MFLYDEPSVPEIDIGGIAEFIEETFKLQVEKRRSILSMCDNSTICDITRSRIHELDVPFQKQTSEIEDNMMKRRHVNSQDNISYDGFELQNALGRAIPKEELTEDMFHIVFTDKFTCTYDNSSKRYHGRAIIGSNPTVISITGIIEAPAKPRAYYIEQMINLRLGTDAQELQKKFKGMFLEYHDPRLKEVVRGYVLQALFYYETHEAFCKNVNCRLYNAHWQEELLHSQIDVGKLCDRHQYILRELTMT